LECACFAPIIVAAPVAVEVEIGKVFLSFFVAESLMENGREMRRDGAVSGRASALSNDVLSRADEGKEKAGGEGRE